MDLRFTPEENAFRDEVRAFMRTALPAPIRRKMADGRRIGKPGCEPDCVSADGLSAANGRLSTAADTRLCASTSAHAGSVTGTHAGAVADACGLARSGTAGGARA